MLRPHLIAALVAFAPTLSAAQSRPEQGAFVVRLGTDTVAVERYTRTATRLESDVAVRVPRTRIIRYTATLSPDGSMSRLDVKVRPMDTGPGALPPAQGALVFGADSARVTLTMGDSTQTVAAAVRPGAMAVTGFAYAFYEQLALRARRMGGDSVTIQIVPFGSNQAFDAYVARRGPDAVDIDYFGSPYHVRTDKAGRMLALDGRETTNKVQVERVARVDVEAAARAFAADDAGGRVLGQLSPRDTVRATVGAAHLAVDYGRPHKRGREIFGSVVPWGQVWRTGANAATGFTTDADLVVGGTTIPKGSYTLWTLPRPDGAKLIVNRQTGQWGTEYDPKQDLVRLDLTSEAVSDPVEVFTIGIDPRGDGGVLTLAWDRTRYALPFTVR
ncbi:MAG TPA: DUF2911 domain-containing protein [Gemmatimonadales bacterium]|nr:DUF2911 domain-containing protein [Gemmatimonadales bacterium]